MDQESFESTLRAYARRTPFRPFLVRLVSGSFVRVDHPEAFFDHEGVAMITNDMELAAAGS